MASGPIISCQIEVENVEIVTDFLFLSSKITAGNYCSHKIRRHLLLVRKAMTNLDGVLKSRGIANKRPHSQGYGLPSGHKQLWELDHKEGSTPKSRCLWIVVLEKTPESLESKEIKPVNLKGNQPRKLIGRTDAEGETPVLGHLILIAVSLEKSLILGKIEGRRKRGHQR